MPEKHTFISHTAVSPPVQIDTRDITHAFIALTIQDWCYRNKVDTNEMIAGLNRRVFPLIWMVVFRVNYGCFAVPATPSGYPNIAKFPSALEQVGLKWPYSIATTAMTAELDGGALRIKINAGFAFRDSIQRIYGNDGGEFVPTH